MLWSRAARGLRAMKYRTEIDGLRAIAVLPVILFHGEFAWFGGGFIGVDVFFVISGYLITSILLTEKKLGNFSLAQFYTRRARRILPALLLVVVACIPFAWAWMAPRNMRVFAKSVDTVAIFASNILFAQQADDYFAVASELTPLLHTWSLAVEEQYYVFFPLLLLLTWRLELRRLAFVLAAIAIVSFAAAQWSAAHRSAAAFYLAHTRAWELMIGGLLAIALLDAGPAFLRSIAAPIRDFAAAVGLALITYAVFAFDRTTPYPGYFALVPTLGASLVILFATAGTHVGRWLGIRILVGVGLVSYSAYLWHQPLFAFYRLRNIGEPDSTSLIPIILLAFALAYLTWRFVETPFRRGMVPTRTFLVGAGSISATLLLFGLVFRGLYWTSSIAISGPLAIMLTPPALCDYNSAGVGVDGRQFCLIGDKRAAPKIAVLGDSHSRALLPGADEIGREVGIGIAHSRDDGCPGLLGIYILTEHTNACHDLTQRQLEYVRDNHIEKVVLASRWTMYTDGDYHGRHARYLAVEESATRTSIEASRIAFLTGVARTIEAYRQVQAEVFVVAEVPQQLYEPDQIYYQLLRSGASATHIADALERMAVPLNMHRKLQEFNRSAFAQRAAAGEITLIDFDSIFCDSARCQIGTPNESYYYDNNHLSAFGASRLTPKIAKYFSAPAVEPTSGNRTE